MNLSDEFDILQIVGEGWFGKILLVEHRATDTEMVLKALPKPYVSLRDFYREFHYGLHLGGHKNIVTTYDVAFETAGFYVFTQEYAPLGDLTSNVSDIGIGEMHTKRVAKQIASALDYIHGRSVHPIVGLLSILILKMPLQGIGAQGHQIGQCARLSIGFLASKALRLWRDTKSRKLCAASQ